MYSRSQLERQNFGSSMFLEKQEITALSVWFSCYTAEAVKFVRQTYPPASKQYLIS